MPFFFLSTFVALLGLGPLDDDPPGLIERLGSPRFQEREAAQRDLLQLGARALPLLQAARTHQDVEVQSRATAILQEVESRLMLEPLRLEHWSRPMPLSAVVAELGKASGRPIRLDRVAGLTHALVSPPPGDSAATFWEVIDRVEKTCGVRAVSAMDSEDEEATNTATLSLVPARAKAPAFVLDRGPFRIKLLSANLQKIRLFEPALAEADEPESSRTFHVQMQIIAEPRLVLFAAGPSRVLEATDDLGQSLVKPAPALAGELDDDVLFLDGGAGPCLTTSLDLALPERPGQRIRMLKGVVPVTVLERRSAPVAIALADPPGKTYENGALRLTLKSFDRGAEEGQVSLELELAANDSHDSALLGLLNGPGMTLAQLLEHQCQVVDGQGKPLAVVPIEIDGSGPAMRVRLAVLPTDPSRKPARLLFYDVIVAAQDVTFTFQDVPLP